MELKNATSIDLVSKLKSLVASERKITADILFYIREVDRRRLYFNYSCSSLFDFLVRELGYSKASAQRRIDSARLLGEVPSIKSDLESGALNLSQVSLVAQYVRQKSKEISNEVSARKSSPINKAELLNSIKDQDFGTSQKILAEKLELEIKSFEKKVIQRDESQRLEITLSKQQCEILERAKELSSHMTAGYSMAEFIEFLAADYIKRKDPAGPKRSYKRPVMNSKNDVKEFGSEAELKAHKPSKARTAISSEVKRYVFKRDHSCQWKDGMGSRCGSKFQLELDHIQPVWAGGGNEVGNLQVLCRAHNQLRYHQQSNLKNRGVAQTT